VVSSIEPLFTFFEKQEEAVFWDVVEPSHVALGLVSEVFNPIDVFMPSVASSNLVYTKSARAFVKILSLWP